MGQSRYPEGEIRAQPNGSKILSQLRHARARYQQAQEAMEITVRELVAAERKLAVLEAQIGWPSPQGRDPNEVEETDKRGL